MKPGNRYGAYKVPNPAAVSRQMRGRSAPCADTGALFLLENACIRRRTGKRKGEKCYGETVFYL